MYFKNKKLALAWSGLLLLLLSHVQLFVTPWTIVHQASLSMGFPRQEYWSGWPFPTPGDLPDPGIEPMSPASPALQGDSLPLSHQGSLPAMTSCHNSENWLRRNGNRLTLELKAILKTVKMTLIRPLMTSFRMTIRADCEVSACSPLPSS